MTRQQDAHTEVLHLVPDESLALQTRGLDKLEYISHLVYHDPLQLRVEADEGSCPSDPITEE